ncbi:MAG: hypothetical protein AB7E81_13120 [Hyphomicrobiaceae bacterium]
MMPSTQSAVVLTAALALGLGTPIAQAEDILGKAPTYATRSLGTTGADGLPNAAAMTRRIWAPELDDGFVPQGLTFVEGSLYLGAYQSAERATGRGPCRVFRIDAETGGVTAKLDLPASCGHAGGLAKGASGHIWVVDTRTMFEIAPTALTVGASNSLGRVVREVPIEPPVKGSFAAGDGRAIWLGSYERDKPGRLYRIPLAAIDGAAVGAGQADTSIELPSRAQGAAFDRNGDLWITRSGAAFGELLHLNSATGKTTARYAMPDGIEDVSFDPSGMIWAVSEAGSRRWSNWATHFPVVFRIDPSRLR